MRALPIIFKRTVALMEASQARV
eukprot:COSAG05_NODE_14962_length_382_cov_0.713781_1_plen_22_part_01